MIHPFVLEKDSEKSFKKIRFQNQSAVNLVKATLYSVENSSLSLSQSLWVGLGYNVMG